MLRIDGSEGEGGGQVLRSALALSVVTGTPVAIDGIRARRKKPGLQRQHLTAVQAAARIGCAEVEGAQLGSGSIVFSPHGCVGGHHEFAIGTAGSTTLVLQTILPALWAADGPSTVRLKGGTHNPMSPPFDFLERSFAGAMARMGAGLELQLHRHGFFPAGGGEITATVTPARWRSIDLMEAAGDPLVQPRILFSSLPRNVADREAEGLCERLGLDRGQVVIQEVESNGPGNVVLCDVRRGELVEVVSSFGQRGVSAERVASRAAKEVAALLESGAAVGEHLADQLLVPMALAGGGAFRMVAPSLHARTNASVVERFLPVKVGFREDATAGNWIAQVSPR